jgi:hypothetical protein
MSKFHKEEKPLVEIRIMSTRPGDVVLSTGKKIKHNDCVVVTEDEAVEAEMLMGAFVKRVN